MPTLTRRPPWVLRTPTFPIIALTYAIGCGAGGPAPDPAERSAPTAAVPVHTTGDRFATCAGACAQHCNTTSPAERPSCEAGQVRCGCAPGMRRPPLAPPTTPSDRAPSSVPVVSEAVPGCFGPHVPLTVWAATPYAEVRSGAATGLFLIDFGSTGSTLDPRAFDPPPDGSLGCYPGLDFFGPWPCLSMRTSDHAGVGTPFRQAGIVGTDVLSQHAYVIDYRAGRLHRSDAFCSEAALREGGLVPLVTTDYGPRRDRSRVNVPAVAVRIGSASAPAQLDTGFADRRVHHSININRAFFDAIAASGAVLERVPSSDLTLSTCVGGVREPVLAYRLAAGALALVGEDGTAARSFDDATIFLKETPPEARRCGGIGTWSEPGAQLGASFFETVGLWAIDPHAGRVWIATE